MSFMVKPARSRTFGVLYVGLERSCKAKESCHTRNKELASTVKRKTVLTPKAADPWGLEKHRQSLCHI